MCGFGNNHKITKGNIKEFKDLGKLVVISGKKKRKK